MYVRTDPTAVSSCHGPTCQDLAKKNQYFEKIKDPKSQKNDEHPREMFNSTHSSRRQHSSPERPNPTPDTYKNPPGGAEVCAHGHVQHAAFRTRKI